MIHIIITCRKSEPILVRSFLCGVNHIFYNKHQTYNGYTTLLRSGGFLILKNRRDNMLTCILLFMVGLKLEMGTAYFVVLAIAAILCCIKFGMNIADK